MTVKLGEGWGHCRGTVWQAGVQGLRTIATASMGFKTWEAEEACNHPSIKKEYSVTLSLIKLNRITEFNKHVALASVLYERIKYAMYIGGEDVATLSENSNFVSHLTLHAVQRVSDLRSVVGL